MIYFVASILFFIGFVVVIVKYLRNMINSNNFMMISSMRLVLNLLIFGNSILIAFYVFLSFQILGYQQYYLIILKIAIGIFYIESASILGILSFKFISWSISRTSLKRSYITWLYGISVGILALNSIFTILFLNNSLNDYPDIIKTHGTEYVAIIPNYDIVKMAYQTTFIFSYITFWISTTVLLSKYRLKIGEVFYWILISLPLIYFLIPFYPGLLNLLSGMRTTDPVGFSILYTLFFSNSISIGGMFFGLAFWKIGSVTNNKNIKQYMHIASLGIVLFFISNQSILLSNAPFPPTVIPYISMVGFASFFILIGIFSSSISITQDSVLRKKIQKAIESDFIFLNNIGSPELEKQVLKKISLISKSLSKDLEKQAGVKVSPEGQELQDYIQDILNELEKNKKDKKFSKNA
jgi:hypothetical protein